EHHHGGQDHDLDRHRPPLPPAPSSSDFVGAASGDSTGEPCTFPHHCLSTNCSKGPSTAWVMRGTPAGRIRMESPETVTLTRPLSSSISMSIRWSSSTPCPS